jgi:hypothetical protein
LTPPTLPRTAHTLVLRTDFRDDAAWRSICDKICRSSCEGFVERYTCVSDLHWADVPQEALLQCEPPPSFYLVVDRIAIEHAQHPVLAVDLSKARAAELDAPRTFRLIPAEASGFACNLNIANMDFWDFTQSVDPDGIFRGFREG